MEGTRRIPESLISVVMEFIGANITIMVADMDRALNFYTEVLGLTLVNRYGNHWADIEGPGITIGLHPTARPVSAGDGLQIGLRVPDIKTVIWRNYPNAECLSQHTMKHRFAQRHFRIRMATRSTWYNHENKHYMDCCADRLTRCRS